MNKLVTYISALALCCSFAQCSDYLNTSSPENTGDEFVTSSYSCIYNHRTTKTNQKYPSVNL